MPHVRRRWRDRDGRPVAAGVAPSALPWHMVPRRLSLYIPRSLSRFLPPECSGGGRRARFANAEVVLPVAPGSHYRRNRSVHAVAPRAPMTPRTGALVAGAGALAFAALAYVPILRAPFIGDDYIFLDQTRAAGFGDLWSFRDTNFGWYRPWSREVHFFVLQHLFGAHEVAFRLASVALWLAALGLFFLLVRRIAGARTAIASTLGATSLALWGAPLCWISG